MIKAKEILAAGIVRDIQFRTVEDMEAYLDGLTSKKQKNEVLETYEREDRTVIIRIVTQYNQRELIKL